MTSNGKQRSLQGTGSPIDCSRENRRFTIGVASPLMALLHLQHETIYDYLHNVDDQRIVYINTLMFINVFLARHKYTGLCLNCQLLSVVCP